MMSRKCAVCSKAFSFRDYRKDTAKYCSMSCNMKEKWARPGFAKKSIERSRERFLGNKLRAGLKPWCAGTKGLVKPWNKGTKGLQTAWNKGLSKETDGRVAQTSKTLSGKELPHRRGANHWNWKGGISEENHLFRNSGPYRSWRARVFKRDGWSCVMCGYRSVRPRDIRADHIKPFSEFPELRLSVENGRTLCLPCDLKHGWQLFREKNPRKRCQDNVK